MQQPKPQDLILAAASIARTTPELWQNFLRELAVYTETHRNNLIVSPLTELPVAQGRAQSMSSLLDTLKDCEKTADKIRNKP